MKERILSAPLFNWVVLCLILFSVVTFSIETVSGIGPRMETFLHYSEVVVVVLFTAEYLLRLYCAPRKWRFIFSFMGIVDLLAILPFYIASSIDLRAVRLLRILRLIRLIKLVRYNSAILRFSKALHSAKEELILFILTSLISFYLAAVGIYHFEHKVNPDSFGSIFDCLWWSVATLTTVGYGDVVPSTNGGRIFTFFVLILGLGLIAVPSGIIASSLAGVKKRDEEQR